MAGARNGWLVLSVPIGVLGGVAAGAGALVPDLYARDTQSFGVQAAAQDWVTLLVAVPAVLVLGWLAWRGSTAARLAWHGVVLYFAYTYAIAAFMVQFNALFLVYTTVLGCSVLAVAGGLATLGWPLPVEVFGASWPRRGTVVLLWTVVAVFLFLWLSDIVPALLAGSQPQSLVESATPTNGVEVLDLSLLLPGTALTAVWLHRREARGQVFATALMGFVVVLGLALAAMVVGLVSAGLASDVLVVGAFVAVTVWAGVLLALATRSVLRAERGAGSADEATVGTAAPLPTAPEHP
jgi:hypothetical protein